MKRRQRGIEWGESHIRALRKHLRLTQSQLAQKMGIRQQTVSDWEVGMYKPRGASATLLTLIAEGAGFKYEPKSKEANQD